MRAVQPMLADVRAHYQADPTMARVVLNAISWFEVSLAVGVLTDRIPARSLVTLANIREAIKELPRCPLPMPTDFESLARTWSLEREEMAWSRRFDDSAGDYSIALLGEGNYVYDIVIRASGRTMMLMPKDASEDFLNPDVVDLMVERPDILGSVIDLTEAMGLPFYPMFYMSLEDWQQEYATAVFGEVLSDFDRVPRELPTSVLSESQPTPNLREPHLRKTKSPSAAA